jgi:Flp pilus assembly protein TadG
VEFAILIPVLSLLVLGAIDFGRAYYLGIEVTNAARAGAQYGMLNPSDTGGMRLAADSDAQEAVSASDVTGWNATPTWGCECSDGTNQRQGCSPAPTCTVNVVNYVQVTTSATYKTLIPWPGIPATIPLSGQATMRIGQ